ncbi:MAG: DUF3500 domain-containing protein [Verrucomicrobiota bacterium]
MKRTTSFLFALAILVSPLALQAQAQENDTALVARSMASAANNFLASLDKKQRATATFAFDNEERDNWHFVPMEDRAGLMIKDMRPDQTQLAYALLVTGMSQQGFNRALSVMSLEQILWELEDHDPRRDPEKYHVTIFGDPTADDTWGWRFEGHHLSLNFTIVDGQVVSLTPSFFGANPDTVLEGPRKGLRVLAGEAFLARKLLQSLDDEQRTLAIIDTKAPRDILTSQDSTVTPLDNKGLPVSKMTDEQKASLLALVKLYLFKHNPRVAQNNLAEIEAAGVNKIRFAWAGGEKPGEGNYYRVQGPTFLLEYCNTQNNANHSHASWRNFKGDFGRNILADHITKHH